MTLAGGGERLAHAVGCAVAAPAEPAALPAALEAAARSHPTHGVVAYDDAGGASDIPYPVLLAQSRRIAAGLAAAGVCRGELALLIIPRLADYFPALWGCLIAGVLPMTLAAPEAYDRPSAALDKIRSAWLGCQKPWVVASRAAVAGLRSLGEPELPTRVLDSRELDGSEAPDAVAGDVALLQLSSGTTGRAKPILLTHRGLIASARDYRDAAGLDPGDRVVNWLPLDHSASLLLTHVFAVVAGATNVHVPTGRVLEDPLVWLDLLAHPAAQHTWAPNFAYRLVADAVRASPERRWDLTAVKSLVNGGEQCTQDVVERFLAATAPFGIRPGSVLLAWGMAETTTAITYMRYDAPRAVRHAPTAAAGSVLAVGPPCPGTELRVVDDAGRTLREREVGRLLLRSERVTPGYLVDGEVQTATADGWLDTGDLAFLEDGDLVIVGRAKDVIVVNGVNLLAPEVEEAAGAVAGVRPGLVAAVGVPDAARGTERLAVAYVASGAAPRAEVDAGITAAVARAVGVAPGLVEPVAEADFPRTSAGKIQRARLRERLSPAPAAERAVEQALAPLPRTDVAAIVDEVFAELVDGQLDRGRPFNELGLGSLELMGARMRLQRLLDIPIAQIAMFEHPTIERLAAHLADSARTARPEARPVHRPDVDRGATAIVGMACRFPGATTVDGYWELLREGRTAVRRFSLERLRAAGVPAEMLDDADYVPVTGALEDVDHFAPDAFGMTQREAVLTAPQQRLLLEVAHEALATSGHEGYEDGNGVGVFAGTGMHLSFLNTYLLNELQRLIDRRDPVTAFQMVVGNEPDFAATRIAYRLGLSGPAVGVQTACSTSLAAIHLACRALAAGDCDVAIAGAGAVQVPHPNGYLYRKGSILSRSGSCRAFDARADGTVAGSGVAAIVLKPLGAARAEGDAIHAVIRGSAMVNDGASKVGFAAPSLHGQRETVERALAAAGVRAETIAYVQAHGTGTPKGDPIEVQALARAFRPTMGVRGSCALGSVKPNVGHLDTCAGLAGLLAAVQALRHREAPPQINYDEPNPELELDDGPFHIPRAVAPLVPARTPLRAGVTALGVGGTNVHVVLEEAV